MIESDFLYFAVLLYLSEVPSLRTLRAAPARGMVLCCPPPGTCTAVYRPTPIPPNDIPEIPEEFPFIIDFAQSLYFHREGKGLLSGMSNKNQAIGIDQNVDSEWEMEHIEAAVKRMPLLEDSGIKLRQAGLYELTPDAHPIIGATPVGGFYLLTGFSGHGFMHGPICGKLMAEILIDGKATSVDISMLDYNRFEENRLIPEYNVV